MRDQSLQRMSAAALLIAIGILIPLFSPLKLVMEPASFTLASHVAIFIAMFISPGVAGAVAVGTTLGFLLGPFPIVVALRAASHLVFALVGSVALQRIPSLRRRPVALRGYSLLIGILHAACELAVVTAFYLGGNMTEAYYQQGFVWSVLMLVGVGSVVHSMVDFEIARVVLQVLEKQRSFDSLLALDKKSSSRETPVYSKGH